MSLGIIQSRKLLTMIVSKMIRLVKQALPMLPKSLNLQSSPSLTAMSQHGQSGKRRRKKGNRQRQPLGMLRIPKGRYYSISIQPRKLLILTVSEVIRLMKQALPMLPKSSSLQHRPSLTATSQHDQSGKVKNNRRRNRQRQPLEMLRIPKGRVGYHAVSIQSRKPLTLAVPKMILLMK